MALSIVHLNACSNTLLSIKDSEKMLALTNKGKIHSSSTNLAMDKTLVCCFIEYYLYYY